MKKLTIIGINYYPETTSTGLYTTQLAEYLSDHGVEVTIVSGFPYYPAWKIDHNYAGESTFFTEVINGVTIHRYKQYVPSNPTFLKRILHLIDYTVGSFFNMFRITQADVVLCIVPFTSTLFLGKIFSVFRKAKLWAHIQDFEFDAAGETMVSQKNYLFKPLYFLERQLLKRTDLSSTISVSMVEKLKQKLKISHPVKLLPNWVDLQDIHPEKSSVHSYLSSKKFKVLYSGNIGEKQDWGVFLNVAEALQNTSDVEFIVVGDGGKRKWFVDRIQSLSNVTHHFPVEYGHLNDLLCSADLHILFQKQEVKDTVMPSKILAMMASQKPSLITGNLDSEVFKIINRANAGYYLNNDVEKIREHILNLKENNTLAEQMGTNARSYVGETFNKHDVLEKFKATLNYLIQ